MGQDEKEDDRSVTEASMTSQTLSDVENDIYLQIDHLQLFQNFCKRLSYLHIFVHSVTVTKIDLITKYSAQYKHLWSSVSLTVSYSYFTSYENAHFKLFFLWVLYFKIMELLKLSKNRLCSLC